MSRNAPSAAPLAYQSPGTVAERFSHAQYVVRKKVFKLFGAAFHVYDTAGSLVLYSKQKAFKLKEDIRLYTDEEMSSELLTIQARQIIDFSAAYDVVDAQTRQKLGALKRKGWSSLVRDSWLVMDPYDREVGQIVEDSTMLALVRRVFEGAAMFMPQKFHMDLGGATVATFQQNFNPFVKKLMVDFSPDVTNGLDKRLGLAAAILMSAIEGRQR
jgi:hypothetical protein